MKRCSKCRVFKARSEFSVRRKVCKGCRALAARQAYTPGSKKLTAQMAAQEAAQRRTIRAEIIKLLGGTCNWEGCDWHDPRALEVHHTDLVHGASERNLRLRILVARIRKEPWRYRLLCSNHHRITHR